MIINHKTPSKQEISILITDNSDPLFLYQIDINEQEFHCLKQDQSLLIEFQHFPQKFFEMLDLCNMNSNSKEDVLNNNINIMNKSLISNYVCILHVTSRGEALLIIQEITQFRQLNHLILKVKLASDEMLKKYLSQQVKDYKGKYEQMVKENTRLGSDLEIYSKDYKSLKEDFNVVKQSHLNEIETLKLQNQKELQGLERGLFEEGKNKLENFEREKTELEYELRSKISELTEKLEIVKQEKLELEDWKNKLELSERDLTTKNNLLQTELKYYKEDVGNLRSEVGNLNNNRSAQESSLTELRIKNDLLIKQLQAKDENILNLNALVDNLNHQKSDLEENYRMIKNTNNKLEDKLQTGIAEINKGNEIIKKLQDDLKAQKQKLKLKQTSMSTQEQLITQKQVQIDELTRNLNDIKRDNEKKDEEIKGLLMTIEKFKLELTDTKKMLAECESVIRFINQKQNEKFLPFGQMMKTNMGMSNNLTRTGKKSILTIRD
jgi:spindle assembly abnormal protein 6